MKKSILACSLLFILFLMSYIEYYTFKGHYIESGEVEIVIVSPGYSTGDTLTFYNKWFHRGQVFRLDSLLYKKTTL